MNLPRTREEKIQRTMLRCVHFDGIMKKTCEAGVLYDTVKDKTTSPFKLACFSEGPICPSAKYYTREEAEAREDDIERHINEFVSKLESGVCPQCDTKVEQKDQVGPCVYARPCGHRLYQGRA